MDAKTGQGGTLYAPSRTVASLEECHFYHTCDIPGIGLVEGDWDLRAGIDAYLGNVEFGSKRVLDLGTADGFLSFHMEGKGAEVVSYDLSEDDRWDVVPFARIDLRHPGRSVASDWVIEEQSFRRTIRRLNNAYWLCHRAHGSSARLVHGDIYSVPAGIGSVDISIFGAILLHTRDPFRALQSAVSLTRETVVVTEQRGRLSIPPPLQWPRRFLPHRLVRPTMKLLPDWRTGEYSDGWWRFSPEVIQSFLGILGFGRSRVTFHSQRQHGSARKLFTVVAHRTVPMPGEG